MRRAQILIITSSSDKELLLFVPSNIMKKTKRGDKMDYMTASQASKKWEISQRRVQILCSEGRIPGVFKLGETWAIPADEKKPEDKRRKNRNEKI